MDYLGWELERQRSALAALLLGGGEARDGESLRDGTQQNGAGMPGDHTGSPGAAPGAWQTRQRHESARAAVVETPVSAWEAILDGEADGLTNSEKAARLRRSGGTGAQPEFLRSYGGYPARRGIRRTEAGPAAETQSLPTKSVEESAASSEARAKQDRASESTAAAKYPGSFLRVHRGGGSTADPMTGDGPAAPRTVPWGGWGAAALRAEDSAKTLSRAVQRDARRYDGGFNIF